MATAETKTPRLLAAAKEFNIGKGTLVEFLMRKGYKITDSPAFKLTEEMYRALQAEYAGDKATRLKSEEIALPKGGASENKKQREEAEFQVKAKKIEEAAAALVSATAEPKQVVQASISAPSKPAGAEKSVISDLKGEGVRSSHEQLALKGLQESEKPKESNVKEAFTNDVPLKQKLQEDKEQPLTAILDESPVLTKGNKIPQLEPKKVTQQQSSEYSASRNTTETARESAERPAVDAGSAAAESNQIDVTVNKVKADAPPQHIEVSAPKLNMPNVLGKIDLGALNTASRPKKSTGIAKKVDNESADTNKPEASANQQPKALQNESLASPIASIPLGATEQEAVQETSVQASESSVPGTSSAQSDRQSVVLVDINVQSTKSSTESQTDATEAHTGNPVSDALAGSTLAAQNAVSSAPSASLHAPKAPAEVSLKSQQDEKPEHIEMRAPKLEGPKIIGKIDLNASAPKPAADSKEKRNRKRIPVNKRPDTPASPPPPGQQQNVGQAQRLRPGGRPDGNQPGQGLGGSHYNRDRRPQAQSAPQPQGNRFQQRPQPTASSQQPQEIDQKAIQDKIRQTQAKLAGNTRGKGQKSKYRRDKRDQMAEKRAAEVNQQDKIVQVTEFISVSELASLLDVGFADVISKCMGLGIMVSINQRLDAEVIELVANEFGFEVSFINLEQETVDEVDVPDSDDDLLPRAPIVTIMGHVDHGKTSLLDYIRSANVVAGEAGGITQHIGAYQVTIADQRKITFLDTPGHEAFTAMRARGAKVADIAVIVIAADDAIMPQTREAISHAQAAALPMIFALNKVDKEGAQPEKIKEQLANMNILVEDWGGKFQSQEISAKKGLNIDLLLEKILLEAELLDLKANPNRIGAGSVIEASLDKGRGYQSTILIQNGTLNQGDMIVCGQYYGKVKAMFNERGQRVSVAGPSTPVQVLGLNGAPQAGEKLKVYDDENEAKEVANHRAQILREQGIRTRKHITLDEIGRRLALGNFRELSVIIKGDFDGSVEALSDSLQKLSTEEVAVNVVHKGVGQITESDVLLATASDAIILGFQVRPSPQAAKLADQENIEIRAYSIIYDAIEEVKSAMEGLLEPKVEQKTVANVEVREVYKISGVGTIAGCYVLDGKISRNSKVNLVRDGIVVYNGELASLKRFKDDVKDVAAGYECGMAIKNYNDIRTGDIIEAYEEISVKRTL